MQAAFEYGADVVEIDIHLTTDKIFAVFHDWRPDCQTDGSGVTHKQSFDYLRTLDLGYDFTTDGVNYPLRGTGVGQISSLSEVFDTQLPRALLINIKGNRQVQGELLISRFADVISSARVFGVSGGEKPTRFAISNKPGLKGFDRSSLKSCLFRYIAVGWSGYVPRACANTLVATPIDYAPLLWGWPHKFTARMKSVNTDVILWGRYDGSGFSSGIDSREALSEVPARFDGFVWTDRIDVIGPLIKGAAINH